MFVLAIYMLNSQMGQKNHRVGITELVEELQAHWTKLPLTEIC